MRVVLIVILLAFTNLASAFTVVLKSGKQLEGTLVLEEKETIRFRDAQGVLMTLKKSTMDLPRMQELQARAEAEEAERARKKSALEQAAAEAREKRTGNAKVYTRESLKTAPQVGYFGYSKSGKSPKADFKEMNQIELAAHVRKLEARVSKLSNSCRVAGGDGDKVLRTDTYVVEGRTVQVTGYWASPDAVASAKKVCAEAVEAQQELAAAKSHLKS